MSTRSGNNKKQGQKYQNTFAFKHNKNSKLTLKIRSSPLDNLCKRCFDILEWKIKYRKYKPLTNPSACNSCHLKNVFKAYRTKCDLCAIPNKLCTKCGEKVEAYVIHKTKKSRKIMNDEIMKLVETLPERYKKTALRKISEGERLQYNPEKGIVNHSGDIIIDNNVCKDLVKGILNDDNQDEGDSFEDDLAEEEEEDDIKENKGETNNNKNIGNDDEESYDDEEDDEEEDNEEEDKEGDGNKKEEIKEELIDTFKNKNKK